MHIVTINALVLACLFHGSLILGTRAQSSQGNILNDEVDAFINQVIANWTSPGGAAVAVVKLDEQGEWHVETKGYGIATLNGTQVTENTRFGIGSNSKLFDVLATGLLVNNETLSPRLTWTTKIASIMPIWGLQDPVASKRANLIDVMAHRTGMPRHDFHYKWKDDVPTVIKKMKYLRPSAEFRDVWQYDNSMYTLLSYLPPLLLPSKTPFTRYVKEHIFDPLGMTSTTYSFDVANGSGMLADGMTKQLTSPSDIFGNGTPRALPFWAPTGGEDGNILSGAGGVISHFVAVLTNDNIFGPYIMEIIKARILDEALGLEPIDWDSRYKILVSLPRPRATPRPTNLALPPVNFTALAGKYNNDGYGEFELCLITPKDPAPSPSCQALASNKNITLPSIIDPKFPTFIGEWDSPWASHVKITHFNGSSFNVSAFSVYPTNDPAEPFWTQGEDGSDYGTYAELLIEGDKIGLGLTGIWGAGATVPSLQGNTARERSEVWFDKV